MVMSTMILVLAMILLAVAGFIAYTDRREMQKSLRCLAYYYMQDPSGGTDKNARLRYAVESTLKSLDPTGEFTEEERNALWQKTKNYAFRYGGSLR
jgi:Flp pilus assembly protein TadG